nr:SCP2 domain-containing protein [Serratia microhaemolytica]
MPLLLTPLLTGMVEAALNRLLFNEPSLKAARLRLVGKRLRLELQELPTPLVLIFSERCVDVLAHTEDQADCTVQTRLAVIIKLGDRQQLSSLMRSGELIVEGDIQVVQHLITLLDLAQWDVADQLAPYLGDVVAQSLSDGINKTGQLLKAQCQKQQRHFAETVMHEWQLAANKLEVAWFNEEVDATVASVDALALRIDQLEITS